jgi:hypothetical protein
MIASGIATAQTDLYVDVEFGCDTNGGTAAAPVQTITQGLNLASMVPPAGQPVTIRVAGRLDAMGGRIPYDNVANNPMNPSCTVTPQNQEGFPLGMLGAVSIVWDVANSDFDPLTGQPVRPLISHNIPGTADFFSFGAGYTPGTTPVTLQGLELEFANRGIMIADSPAGLVRPTLSDLKVFDSLQGVRVTAGANPIDFDLLNSTLQLRSASMISTSDLVYVLATASGVTGLISGSTVQVDPLASAGAGLTLIASTMGSVDVTVEGCTVRGAPPPNPATQGIAVGLLAGSTVDGTGNTSQLLLTVREASFSFCGQHAIDVQFSASGGVTQASSSGATISSNLFDRNWRTLSGPATVANEAQVTVTAEAGRTLGATISGNLFRGSSAHGISSWNTNTAGGAVGVAGSVGLTISGNTIEGGHTDGIHIRAQALIVSGTISGNKILDVTDNGIENYAVYNAVPPARSISTVSIVNNMIAYPASHGIYNHVNAPAAPLFRVAAAPPTTHTSVASAGGVGILNAAVGGAPLPTFAVTNGIMRFNVGPDFVGLTQGAGGVTFSNFVNPAPMGTNNALAPGFVSLSGRDLHLATGSLMRDLGTNTPPASPALDFDGNLRRIDLPGVPNGPAGFADLGADERTIP